MEAGERRRSALVLVHEGRTVMTTSEKQAQSWAFSGQMNLKPLKQTSTSLLVNRIPHEGAGSALPAGSILDVDDYDAQGSHQAQRLDAQEPEQQPEEEDHHRLHGVIPEVHVAEADPAQALIDHPEERPHPLAVIRRLLCSAGRLLLGQVGINLLRQNT